MIMKIKAFILLSFFTINILSCNSFSIQDANADSALIDTTVEVPEANTEPLIQRSISTIPRFVQGPYPFNNIEFNEGNIHLDPTAPDKIDIYPDSSGIVYLQTKDFSGNSVPFIGYASKAIKSLIVNGKKISFNPDEEFFFRQEIDLYIGYNRIPIKITNVKNKILNTYLEINMERVK